MAGAQKRRTHVSAQTGFESLAASEQSLIEFCIKALQRTVVVKRA